MGKIALELANDPEIMYAIPEYQGKKMVDMVENPDAYADPEPHRGLVKYSTAYSISETDVYLVLDVMKNALEYYESEE